MLQMASFRDSRSSSCDPMQNQLFEIIDIFIEKAYNFNE